jgi:hypothetical protein
MKTSAMIKLDLLLFATRKPQLGVTSQVSCFCLYNGSNMLKPKKMFPLEPKLKRVIRLNQFEFLGSLIYDATGALSKTSTT